MAEESKSSAVVFDITSSRQAMTKDKAVELVADIISGKKRDYTKIVLGTWSFDVESAKVFAEAIALLKDLKEADIGDIIVGKDDDVAEEVLNIIAKSLADKDLTYLDISYNALGPAGLKALMPVLSAIPNVEHLFVQDVGLSAKACENLAEVLLKDRTSPMKLKTLRFWNNMSGDDGAKAIAKLVEQCPELSDFRWSSTRGGRAAGVALCEALRATTSLRRLDFNDNTFREDGTDALVALLQQQPNIQELYIGDLGLEDEGVRKVIGCLSEKKAFQLRELDLSANEMEPETAELVAEFLKQLPDLEVFRLVDAPELGVEGLMPLVKALASRPNLRSVDFSRCDLTSAALVAIAKALAPLSKLEEVDFQGNLINEAGRKAVSAALGSRFKEMEEYITDDEEFDDADVEGLISDLEGLTV